MSRILLVDDDPMTIEIARHALALAGFEVLSTDRPHRVVELAATEDIDLVVLDVQMPELSGFEVLAELQAQPSTQEIPILFLSARSDSADRIEGLRAGANDYLTKPFDPTELTLRVERLVAQRRDRALVGRIDSFAVSDLVQHLAETKKNGFLIVGSGTKVGRFVFAEGALRSASFGRLVGREALIAAVDLDTGRFEFMTREVAAPTAAWKPAEIDLRSVLLEAAWLGDELAARRPLLPPADERWTRPGRPDDLARAQGRATLGRLPDLPLAEVLDRLAKEPAVTTEELVAELRFAPQRVHLALAVLCELDRVAAPA